ncbi:class II myosin [Conglomerata obtusa]
MHKENKEQQTKKWVWIPTQEHTYIPAYIHTTDTNKTVVITQDNQKLIVNTENIYKMNPSKFKMVEDLALLSHLNEPSVLHNIKERYEHDLIYTYSGLFLLAINPYKEIRNLYDTNTIVKYKQRTSQSRNYVSNDNLQPHIFAVSNDAYNSMVMNKENQSILITGESGAGKTENTKKVINFLAHVANQHEYEASSSMDEYITNISAKILETNTVLEAFGNAQTIKNDNSSRFGKFIKIEFLHGKITGANIEKYLLEKSRVTRVNKNERNYHVFYQLIQAIRKNLKNQNRNIEQENGNIEYCKFLEELRITLKFSKDLKLNDFKYLKGLNVHIENVDDSKEFKNLIKSMDILEFTIEDKIGIFKILSIILHLGNLEFREVNDQAELINYDTLNVICELLKINSTKFLNSLISPITKAGNEDVTNSRTTEQVMNIIEALSRLLYERMFDTLINKINTVLGKSNYYEKRNSNFIGVLDIAGFEIFERNDFEQFCINFTNEKLQQFFNHHMFILEQEIYRKENIDWKFIDFGLNLQPTIDLIEKSNPIGILSYLDEECVMPKGTDRTFLEKLREIENDKNKFDAAPRKHKINTGKVYDSYYFNKGNKDIEKPVENKVFKLSKLKHTFIIEHYAGKVEYIVDNWLKKNKDPHFDYLTSLLKQSSDTYVQHLFSFDSQGKKGFFRTVSQKHKDSLNLLMEQLKKTNPYFVRCIIPNNNKKSNFIVNSLVLHQLKCNGVMEGIRISRQGYPTRMLYKEFRKRYQILVDETDIELIDNKQACLKILKTIESDISNLQTQDKTSENNTNISKELNMYKIGNTMIFFRQGVLAEIEDLREKKIDILASELQSLIRKKLTINKFNIREIRSKAIKIIQKNALLSLSFRNWNWWKLYLKVKPLLEITKMDHEIKLRDEKISEANNAVNIEKIRNDEIKNAINLLEIEKDNLEKELEKERVIINEREDLLNALRNENNKIKEDLNNQKKENNFLAKEAEESKNNYIQLKENNKKIEDKIYKILDEQENYKQNNIKITGDLEKYKDENNELKEKLVEREIELNKTQKMNKSQIDQVLMNKEKDLAKVKNQLAQLIDEKTEKENILNKMKFENESINEKNKEIYAALDNEKKELNKINESLNAKLIENISELKLLQEQNLLQENENKRIKEQAKKLNNENEDYAIEIDKIKQENLQKNKKISKLEKDEKILQELMKKEKDVLAQVKQNLCKIEFENKILKEEIDELKNNNQERNLTQENLIEKIKNLNLRIQEAEENTLNEKELHEDIINENKMLRDENNKLQQSKLDEIFERENEFNKIKKSLKSKIQDLETKLINSVNQSVDTELLERENLKKKKLEKLLKEQENNNLKLLNELETVKMENNKIKKQLEILIKNEDEESNNKIKIKSCMNEIERLKNLLNEKGKEYHNSFLKILIKYRNDCRENESKLLMTEQELENVKTLLQNKEFENEKINEKVKKLKKINSDEKEEFNKKLIISNNLYEQIKKELNEVKNEFEENKIKYKEIKKELNKIKTEKDEEKEKYEKQINLCFKEEKKLLNKVKDLELIILKNEENIIKFKYQETNENSFYVCEGCTFDLCVCTDSCLIRCKKDSKMHKMIEDLKIECQLEKEKNRTLLYECESINKAYKHFGKEFEDLLKKEKENKATINGHIKDSKVNKNLLEMKNNEIIMHKNEIRSLKDEINIFNSINRNLEFQCSEYKKRNTISKKECNNENELKNERSKREELEEKIIYYESEINRYKIKEKDLLNEVEQKEIKLKDLENELNSWKGDYLENKLKCNSYVLKIHQLEREIEEEKSIYDLLNNKKI